MINPCKKYIQWRSIWNKFYRHAIMWGVLYSKWKRTHCKKPLSCKDHALWKLFAIFPSPAGMSLTKLFLAGNNLIISGQREFGKWHPGWGWEYRESFFTVRDLYSSKDKSRLKAVLLYLWRTNLKPTGGFYSNAYTDFCISKLAPWYNYELLFTQYLDYVNNTYPQSVFQY